MLFNFISIGEIIRSMERLIIFTCPATFLVYKKKTFFFGQKQNVATEVKHRDRSCVSCTLDAHRWPPGVANPGLIAQEAHVRAARFLRRTPSVAVDKTDRISVKSRCHGAAYEKERYERTSGEQWRERWGGARGWWPSLSRSLSSPPPPPVSLSRFVALNWPPRFYLARST